MPKNFSKYILLLLSLYLYIQLTYFTARHESLVLLAQFGMLFLFYLLYYRISSHTDTIKLGIYAAILFRLSLIVAIPNLSDDFYRFIWDGRLINQGINPFEHIPKYFIDNPETISEINHALYINLNSKENHTIYPPVLQAIFWFSAFLSPSQILGSVVIMRLFIILAEIGSILLIRALLKRKKANEKLILLYALNPLIILEFSGNLHFESFMIFFIFLSFYFLDKKQIPPSATVFSLSVCSKLNPLIFMPLLFKRLGFKKAMIFSVLALVLSIIMFLPFFSTEFIRGMTSSISLYFQKFEFNASIYYLVREVGYWIKGYNIIQTAGKYLFLAAFLSIIGFSIWERNKGIRMEASFLWVYFIYLLFATIVHPWYITPLIAFSVFTNFRFPILWSFLIFFSYWGYSQNGYTENLWIVSLEYLILGVYILREILNQKSSPNIQSYD